MPKRSSSVESWVKRFRGFMARRRYSRFALKCYTIVARAFLRFLEVHDVDPATAQSSHIRSYLKVQRARYRRRQRRDPLDAVDWRSHHTAPIHLFFRMAQGQWPPPSEIGRRLARFRAHVRNKRYSRHAIINYCIVAHRFLVFLERRAVILEQVQPADVSAYIEEELRRYRYRFGREPKDLVVWRCGLTPAVHRLLRLVQGQWPPPLPHPWFERFRAHMDETCPCRMTRGHYVYTAGRFLSYLQEKMIPMESTELVHVEAYRRIKLAEYRQRHGRLPADLQQWRRETTIPIHRLLRLVHGRWPPEAPTHPVLEQLHVALLAERHQPDSRDSIERVTRQFLAGLRAQGVLLKQAKPADVESFMQERLIRYRRRRGHMPPKLREWRQGYTGPIHRLLRLAQGCWPPPSPLPATPRDRFCRDLREGFRQWMMEVRGLSVLSFTKDCYNADRLIEWLGDRASADSLRQLTASDLDAFLAWRAPGLRRATRSGVCQGLRSFLRYLHAAGFIERDLASCVTSPPRYWNEGITSTFTDAQVKAMLAVARADCTALGRRDYAIFLLLATYGLRAGEITRLRLEDIDWRRERFRITQSKSGRATQLPLIGQVGEAILDYLRHGRPEGEHREVFLRQRVPYSPFACGSSLGSIVHRRLRQTGITVTGRHGAHAFRYARAVSLLHGAMPLKAISDLLGHRSSNLTDVYLKLATDDLRDVGLELPQEVAP